MHIDISTDAPSSIQTKTGGTATEMKVQAVTDDHNVSVTLSIAGQRLQLRLLPVPLRQAHYFRQAAVREFTAVAERTKNRVT